MIFFLLIFICHAWIEVGTNSSVLIPLSYSSIIHFPTLGILRPYTLNSSAPYTIYDSPQNEGWYTYGTSNQNFSLLVCKPCSVEHVHISNWGQWNAIPSPQVQMTNNQFNISVAYVRELLSYHVNLCEWKFNTTSTCQTDWSSQSPFYSAPTAKFSQSLGNPFFGAYNHKNLQWDMMVQNCSQILYFTREWNLSTILNCKNSQPCVNQTFVQDTPFIDYSGSLKVFLIKNGTHVIQKWEWPFSYRFNTFSTILSGQAIRSYFDPLVSTWIDSQGHLVIQIQTTVKEAGKFLDTPVFDSGLNLKSTTNEGLAQIWIFSSQVIQSIYQAVYSFSWLLKPDQIPLGLQISVSMIKQVPVSNQHTLNTKLQTFRSNFSYPTSGPFDSKETVLVASIYQGKESLFQMKIFDVWVCYPVYADMIPEYDPEKGQLGCSSPSAMIPAANILRIFDQGKEVIDSKFKVVSFPNQTIENLLASAFSIQFSSSQWQDRILYIHVKTQFLPFKRQGAKIANDLIAIYMNQKIAIEAVQDLKNQIHLLYIFLSISLALGLVCSLCITGICMGYVKWQKTNMIKKEWKTTTEKHKEFLKTIVDDKISNKMAQPLSTIDDLFKDASLFHIFQKFCEKQKNKENVMFYLNYQQWKIQTDPIEKQQMTTKIFKQFIEKNSAWELNIPDSMRTKDNHLEAILGIVKLDLQQNTFVPFMQYVKQNSFTEAESIEILKH